jgi:hypothetical protein
MGFAQAKRITGESTRALSLWVSPLMGSVRSTHPASPAVRTVTRLTHFRDVNARASVRSRSAKVCGFSSTKPEAAVLP